MKTKQPKAVHQKSFWKRCVEHRALILMSLPGLAAVFIFSYIPMYGILIAFQNYNPVDGMFAMNNWVGLKYFKQFLSNPYLFRLIRNLHPAVELPGADHLRSFDGSADQRQVQKGSTVHFLHALLHFYRGDRRTGKELLQRGRRHQCDQGSLRWAGHFLYDRSQVLQDHLHCQQYLAGTWMGSYRIPGSAFRSRSPAS